MSPSSTKNRLHGERTGIPAVPRVRWLMLAALSLAGAGSGCFETSFRDGQFACASDGTCPPGLQCAANNQCVRDPSAIGVDASDGNPPVDFLAARVKQPIAIYVFNEGDGNLVHDLSNSNPPLDLTISVVPNVVWSPGVLRLEGETLIVPGGSPQASDNLRTTLQASGALTLEAWITPKETATNGPRRIIALSESTSAQSFVMAQGGRNLNTNRDSYVLRLRTSDLLDTNGTPGFETPVGSATTQLTHLVYTRTALGKVTAYLDSIAVATTVFDSATATDVPATTRAGDLSIWEAGHLFGLGNERDGVRQWTGELHLVAVYARALDAGEVKQNFMVGPDPELAVSP